MALRHSSRVAKLDSLGHFTYPLIMPKIPKQSYWWYAPVVVALLLGYLVGAALAFGLYFLDWIPQLTSEVGRFTVSMFGMGMLGATTYSTQWFAKDMEESLSEPKYLPHFFDAFGYATTIVGGGIFGVVFFLALKLASVLAFSTDGSPTIRPTAGFVVAFCGGLAQFKIQPMLMLLATKWAKIVDRKQDEPETKDDKPVAS